MSRRVEAEARSRALVLSGHRGGVKHRGDEERGGYWRHLATAHSDVTKESQHVPGSLWLQNAAIQPQAVDWKARVRAPWVLQFKEAKCDGFLTTSSRGMWSTICAEASGGGTRLRSRGGPKSG